MNYIVPSASSDNIRLWNASEGADSDVSGKARSGVPFKIIPGHHGGIISQMGACLLGYFHGFFLSTNACIGGNECAGLITWCTFISHIIQLLILQHASW